MKVKEKISHLKILKRLRAGARLFVVALTVIGLGTGLFACSAGGGSENSAENGEVLIGLTDAPGDFQTYTVDVVSLTLTKANGTVVETLPVQTTVDFAQYTEMTEFLTAATIPSGVYTKASMVLDYSNANIQVEDEAGATAPVTMIKDEDGNDITTMELQVQLEDRNQLLIAPGIPANLTLDFDLKASNQVSFDDAGEPTVVVEPFLVADVDLDKNKTHRLRGALKSVNVAAEYYEVIVRPFHHHINDQVERFGSIKVNTSNETLYEIDQVAYSGAEGLQQLDNMTTFAATVAIGEIKFNPRRFEASHVYAGSSVPGGENDVVNGNVIKRVDNTLTVKGATLIRAGGSVIFRDVVTVQIADTTIVRRQHSMDEHAIGDISIGQHVIVFGALTNEAPESLELDATEGHIGMLFTTLHANAIVPVDPAPFTAELQSIDHRQIGIFDFTGTGSTPEEDADPAAYEIDTSVLDISSIADGSPIKVRGFVRPFGQAPADFEARTIIDVAAIRGHLGLGWNPATTTPFLDLSSTGMTLNLEGQGLFHHVVRAGVRVDLNSLAQSPVIQPLDSGAGVYVMHTDAIVQLLTTFDSYVAEIEAALSDGKSMRGIRATGLFDDATGTMKAGMISVRMM